MPSRPVYLQDAFEGAAFAHRDTVSGAVEDGDEEQWRYQVGGRVGDDGSLSVLSSAEHPFRPLYFITSWYGPLR